MEVIPKWLIAEDVDGERTFVLHLPAPFLEFEVFRTSYGYVLRYIGDSRAVDWDCPSEQKADRLAKLAREAGDAMHNAPNINSKIVRSERELGEWYANYDGRHSWFENGVLFARNCHGTLFHLCEGDTENNAYLKLARLALGQWSVWVEMECRLRMWISDSPADPEVPRWTAMAEKLREVKS